MSNGMKSLWGLLAIATALSLSPLRAAEQPSHTDRSTTGTSSSSKSQTDREGTSSSKDGKPAAAGQKIDLNSASQEQLESLPGVGPVTAKAIVTARPFKSVNELTNVSGISQTRLATLKPLVTVKAPNRA